MEHTEEVSEAGEEKHNAPCPIPHAQSPIIITFNSTLQLNHIIFVFVT
ncbi:hypothetical protein [Nostoc sp. CMAA1605]|nr:hypothetical protein [Nostoc sp. CMAA1605]